MTRRVHAYAVTELDDHSGQWERVGEDGISSDGCALCRLRLCGRLAVASRAVLSTHRPKQRSDRCRPCLMRETIYLQAGPTANFLGSHFFCTQFAYFPENDPDDVPVDLDVVFRNAQTQNARTHARSHRMRRLRLSTAYSTRSSHRL